MYPEHPSCEDEVPALVAEAYRRYFPFWRNLAKMSQVSEEDARDLVHNVLSNILSRRDLHFDSLEHVRNYVARGVLNRAIQSRQRSVRRISIHDEMDPCVSEGDDIADMEHREETEALRTVLRELSAKDYEIIKLRFFGGLTFAQICDMIKTPVSTLKSREEAALRRMKKHLDRIGYFR